jgi:adenylate cyclase
LKNIARSVQVWHWPVISATDPVSTKAGEDGPLPLPKKPSIAVLPFNNMSGDPQEEFFADGMAEDIITALSRHRSLFVIARNSTFAYKGQSPDLRWVSAELGVRYVLEGSVRKGGDRVRITAQLIEGASGNHIWAERYDRTLDDIFAVQDEMTQAITARIGPEIDQAERDRARTMPPKNLDVWES